MKITSNTIALIIAFSSLASTAPLALKNRDSTTLVAFDEDTPLDLLIPVANEKRLGDVDASNVVAPEGVSTEIKAEVISLLDELTLLKVKRDLVEDPSERAELEKRWFTILALLVGVLYETGVLGAVWDFFAQDVAQQGPISLLIGEGMSNGILKVPELLSGISQSGFFNKFIDKLATNKVVSSGWMGGLFKISKLVIGIFVRDDTLLREPTRSKESRMPSSVSPILGKRETEEMAKLVVDKVVDAGMTLEMIELGLDSSDKAPDVVAAALKNNVMSVDEIYALVEQNNLTESVVQYMNENEATFSEPVIEYVEEKSHQNSIDGVAFPSSIASGISQSDVPVPTSSIFISSKLTSLITGTPTASIPAVSNAVNTDFAASLSHLSVAATSLMASPHFGQLEAA